MLSFHLEEVFGQDLNDYSFASFTSTTTGSLEFYTITMSTAGGHEEDAAYTVTNAAILPASFSNLPNRSVIVLSETSSSYSLKTLTLNADLPSGALLLIEDLDSSEELRITFKNSAGAIIDPSVNISQYLPVSGAPSVVTNTANIRLTGSVNAVSFPASIFQTRVGTVRSIEIESRNHPVVGSQVFVYLAMPTTVLPVDLISFTISQEDHLTANLTWETAAELNNDYFSIERKTPVDTEWQEIGRKEGQGTYDGITNYRFMDHLQESGTYYYRLKQMDIDGRFSYSSTKTLEVDAENIIEIYPNPARDQLNLEFDKSSGKPLQLTVMSSLGRITHKETLHASSRDDIIKLDVSNYAAGIYFVKLIVGEKRRVVRILIE